MSFGLNVIFWGLNFETLFYTLIPIYLYRIYMSLYEYMGILSLNSQESQK